MFRSCSRPHRWILPLLLALRAFPAGAQTACDAKSALAQTTFGASCAGATCSFSLTSSIPSVGLESIQWDFGDGSSISGLDTATAHTYASAAYYVVTMTLVAGDGQVSIATGGVRVLDTSIGLAADDAFSTERDSPLAIQYVELLSNDAPSVQLVSVGGARCAANTAGTGCTYYPPTGFVGTDSFPYSVRDAAGNTAQALIQVTVVQPLVAAPDQFRTFVGVPILITTQQLLANDSPGAVFVKAENALHGSLAFVSTDSNGVATYRFTPPDRFAGTASFEYVISWDGNTPFERGVVSIEVIDGPPHAVFTVACVNRVCTTHPTSYDDIGIEHYLWNWGDGGPTVEVTSPYGWADQTHTYASSGRYTITHTVVDTSNQTDALQLEVVANTRPIASNDSSTTDRDVAVTVPLLDNDRDPDGDRLAYSAGVFSQNAAQAQAVQRADGTWAVRITPPDSFVGTLTWTYKAVDPLGASSDWATVSVRVNQWASITDAIGEQLFCPQNGSIRIAKAFLLSNDFDSDGDALSITNIDTQGLAGSLDCTSDPTACTFHTWPGMAGVTSFRYTATDPAGHHDTAIVHVYVGVKGVAPTAKDDFFTTQRDTPLKFVLQDVVQNDVDPDGDTLTMGLGTGPTGYGAVTCSTPMYQCTYVPRTGFVGTDRIPYLSSDTLNPAASGTINVLILPSPNQALDAREEVVEITGDQVYLSYAGLLSNDYSANGALTVASVDASSFAGTVDCDSNGCLLKPNSFFQGLTTFRYTARNSQGATDTALVRVRKGVTNTAPVAAAQAMTTRSVSPLKFSVFELLRGCYDRENDPLGVTVFPTGLQRGTLSCGSPQYWCTYTPYAGATGTDKVTFAVSDGAASISSTLTITVTP